MATALSVITPFAFARLGSLGVRRAALLERMARAPEIAARSVDGWIDAIPRADVALVLASTLADIVRRGQLEVLAQAGRAAADLGLAPLFAVAPPRRAIARLGRMPEVAFSERASFWPFVTPPTRHDAWPRLLQLRVNRERGRLRHPNPVVVERMLRQWLFPLSDVVVMASRRPTTPAIALAIASHEGWLGRREVRCSLRVNPFSPTWLVVALLPEAPSRELRWLVSDGYAPVARAAEALLRRREAASASATSTPTLAAPPAG